MTSQTPFIGPGNCDGGGGGGFIGLPPGYKIEIDRDSHVDKDIITLSYNGDPVSVTEIIFEGECKCNVICIERVS